LTGISHSRAPGGRIACRVPPLEHALDGELDELVDRFGRQREAELAHAGRLARARVRA
jgi:hypothetical protein